MSLYGTEWKERGFGLRVKNKKTFNIADGKESLSRLVKRMERDKNRFSPPNLESKGFLAAGAGGERNKNGVLQFVHFSAVSERE
jgi:hypothetical protein